MGQPAPRLGGRCHRGCHTQTWLLRLQDASAPGAQVSGCGWPQPASAAQIVLPPLRKYPGRRWPGREDALRNVSAASRSRDLRLGHPSKVAFVSPGLGK